MPIKLRIRHGCQAKALEIDASSTLATLKRAIGTMLQLGEGNDFDLSMNRSESLMTLHDVATTTIQSVGLVSGDSIFVTVGSIWPNTGPECSPTSSTATDNSTAASSYSPSGGSTATGGRPASDVEMVDVLKENDYAPSPSTSSGYQPPNQAGLPTETRSKQPTEPGPQYPLANQNWTELESFIPLLIVQSGTSPVELVILLAHGLLRKKRFVLPGQSAADPAMPASWTATGSAGFYRLQYSHPMTDVALEMTFTVTGHGAQLLCNGSGKVGDTVVSKQCTVSIQDHVKRDLSFPLDNLASGFLHAQDTAQYLLDGFLDELTLAIVGQDSHLARLPNPILLRVLKPVPVRTLINLSLTCKLFRELGSGPLQLWRHYLVRDFGESSLNVAEADYANDFKQCYKAKYAENLRLRAPHRRHLEDDDPLFNPLGQHIPRPPFYQPPDGIRDPRRPMPNHPNPYFPGMIGGPDDLMPLSGHVNMPNIYPNIQGGNPRPGYPMPGGRGRIPGPRFDPMLPDDPDAGLHPFPGSGSRRNRGGLPSNPFGRGFPDFL